MITLLRNQKTKKRKKRTTLKYKALLSAAKSNALYFSVVLFSFFVFILPPGSIEDRAAAFHQMYEF